MPSPAEITSADKSENRTPRFFLLTIILGLLILSIYIFAGVLIFRYGTLTKDYGWQFNQTDAGWQVSKIELGGAAQGKLQSGDRILSLNGDARVGIVGPALKLERLPVDQSYTLRVERNAVVRDVALPLPLRADNSQFARQLSLLFVSLVFFITGMLVGLLKPEHHNARLHALAGLAVAVAILTVPLLSLRGFFSRGELLLFILCFCIRPFHFAIGYHAYSTFPPGPARPRFWNVLRYLLYAWALLLCVAARIEEILLLRGEDAALDFMVRHEAWLNSVLASYRVFQIIALCGILGVLASSRARVYSGQQRRRLRWVVYGIAFGVLPLMLYYAVTFTLDNTGQAALLSPERRQTLIWLVFLTTITNPIALCYAIVAHALFDVKVVIRRSVQYLLARNVLRLILALPLVGLAYGVISNPNRPLLQLLSQHPLYAVLIVAVALSLKFNKQLTRWIDRKFFREAYRQEAILRRLTEQIKHQDSLREISRLASKEIEAALHPQRFYLFYRDGDRRDLSLGFSSAGRNENLHIAEDFALLRMMESHGRAQELPLLEKQARQTLPANEVEWLNQLGINLLVPMMSSDDRLTGLVLLGEKKSEEPYTATDRELLEAVAGQIAIVQENLLLKGRVDRDAQIKREVLSRFEEQQISLVRECPVCGRCYDGTVEVCVQDNHELILSLPVERIVDGKYRLEQLLGKGGMGAVYAASDLRLERQVAVKFLLGRMFGDRAALRRFTREAQAAARLNHPAIITVYDYGSIIAEGAYLVMELVRGRTLQQEFKSAGFLPPQLVADWFEQVLDGMSAAHEAGVIHRDLKPDNIFITTDGRIKILDFGLAKTRWEERDEAGNTGTLTTPGTVMGTLNYMAPEQLCGEEADERSDIFALGVIIVEALTARRPFTGKSYAELLNAVTRQPYRLPAVRAEILQLPEVARLNKVLRRALAKQQHERFASVAALRDELIPALRACPPLIERDKLAAAPEQAEQLSRAETQRL